MGVPHDLVPWGRVFGTAELYAESGDQKNGIPGPGAGTRQGQVLTFAFELI